MEDNALVDCELNVAYLPIVEALVEAQIFLYQKHGRVYDLADISLNGAFCASRSGAVIFKHNSKSDELWPKGFRTAVYSPLATVFFRADVKLQPRECVLTSSNGDAPPIKIQVNT